MKILKSKADIRQELQKFENQQLKIGFVPTMGALHKGHVSLFEKAKTECDIVIASIFVNPTQFNNLNDLNNYPRTFDEDCEVLQAAGCDLLFAPEINELYTKQELENKKQNIEDKSWTNGKVVDFGILNAVMEGAKRPGHFNGVAQVVSKLFRIIEPSKAYFGLKDFQQLLIIKSMVKQLDLPVEIVACPIVRELNGLAMSSRNKRLTDEQQEIASNISKILFEANQMINTSTISEIKNHVIYQVNLIEEFELEYFEIANATTLQSVNTIIPNQNFVACIAIKIGDVRLIDNLQMISSLVNKFSI